MKYLKCLIFLILPPILGWGQRENVNDLSYQGEERMTITDNQPVVESGDVSGKDETTVKLTVFLEGPFGDGKMNTNLNKAGLIPLSQPFNQPPWNYAGTEAVDSIPVENIVDWILVDIRAADSAGSATSASIFARKAGFLMSNGLINNIDGSTLLSYDTVFS